MAGLKHQGQYQIDRQINEEIEKAGYFKQLRQTTPSGSDDNMPTEALIIEAEHYRFFEGSIRFLFRNGLGATDWTVFRAKFEKAKEIFGQQDISVDRRKRIPRIVLRNFVSRVLDWDLLTRWDITYDSSDESWKLILTNDYFVEPVHQLLSQPLLDDQQLKQKSSPFEGLRGVVHKELFATDFLEYTTWEPFLLRDRWENYYMAPYNAKSPCKHYYLGLKKNYILTQAIDNHIIFWPGQNYRIHNSSFCWGYNILFAYKMDDVNNIFLWDYNRRIMYGKLDSNGGFIGQNDNSWRDASSIQSVDEFVQILKELIADSKQ